MIVKEQILRYSPIWVLRFIYADMLKFAYLLSDVPDCDMEAVSDHISHLGKFQDNHVQQIVAHLNYTSTCIAAYVQFNNLDIDNLQFGDEVYHQARATWNVITEERRGFPQGYENVVIGYSDKNYMYCISLWNCAYQIIMNEMDVYNETFGQFLECLEELTNGNITCGDERTQPLFKLISQIGNFRIGYEKRAEG
ncbi:MAG: hypothetical protein WKF66_00150 [Pedobacter sp.]